MQSVLERVLSRRARPRSAEAVAQAASRCGSPLGRALLLCGAGVRGALAALAGGRRHVQHLCQADLWSLLLVIVRQVVDQWNEERVNLKAGGAARTILVLGGENRHRGVWDGSLFHLELGRRMPDLALVERAEDAAG